MCICSVHLSSAATVNTPLYQTWVNSFGPLVTHIYAGNVRDALIFVMKWFIMLMLSPVDEEAYNTRFTVIILSLIVV